jgi:hypothetical protein
MVAKHIVHNESGQSILEIVFILPFLFLFVGLLYKLNMAVQMAINNTQYARSQIYVLAANSPEYPRLNFRFYGPNMFAQNEQDEMILGVADPSALATANATDGSLEPIPQTQKIARKQTDVPGSQERGEVQNRTEIRVRNTAAICTQLNAVAPKKPMTSDNIRDVLKAQRWPFHQEVCQYKGKKEG